MAILKTISITKEQEKDINFLIKKTGLGLSELIRKVLSEYKEK